MAEFVAFDPNVEVSGHVLTAWLLGTERKIEPLLSAHGINGVEGEGWYHLQSALDALYDFSLNFPIFNAGMLIPEYAPFPPDIHDIESGLNLLDVAYHINHRQGEIGHYMATRVNERTFDVIAENPYPCEFDYGLMHNLAHRLLPEGVEIKIVHDRRAPCRKNGASSCTYHISW